MSGPGGRALSSPGQVGRRGGWWPGQEGAWVLEGMAEAASATWSMNRGSGHRAQPPAPPTTATDWPPWDAPEPLEPPDQPPAPHTQPGSWEAAVCTPRVDAQGPSTCPTTVRPQGLARRLAASGRSPGRPTSSTRARGRLGIIAIFTTESRWFVCNAESHVARVFITETLGAGSTMI